MSDRSADDALYISIFPYQRSLNYRVFRMIHFRMRNDDRSRRLRLLGMIHFRMRNDDRSRRLWLLGMTLRVGEVAQSCSFFIAGLCGLVLIAAVVLRYDVSLL